MQTVTEICKNHMNEVADRLGIMPVNLSHAKVIGDKMQFLTREHFNIQEGWCSDYEMGLCPYMLEIAVIQGNRDGN